MGVILEGNTCPAFGDFNRDGQLDVCYRNDLVSPSGVTRSTGFWIVQGGSIELTTISVAIGMRIHL